MKAKGATVLQDRNGAECGIASPSLRHGEHARVGRYIPPYLAAGDTKEDILEEFPDLEEADIQACLAFAVLAVTTKGHIVIPFAA